MKITVPPEIERALTARAGELGTSPEVPALESLRQRFARDVDDESDDESKGKTLADFLKGYVGVLNSSEHVSGGARMSETRRKNFVEGLAKKREAGHL